MVYQLIPCLSVIFVCHALCTEIGLSVAENAFWVKYTKLISLLQGLIIGIL